MKIYNMTVQKNDGTEVVLPFEIPKVFGENNVNVELDNGTVLQAGTIWIEAVENTYEINFVMSDETVIKSGTFSTPEIKVYTLTGGIPSQLFCDYRVYRIASPALGLPEEGSMREELLYITPDTTPGIFNENITAAIWEGDILEIEVVYETFNIASYLYHEGSYDMDKKIVVKGDVAAYAVLV